MSLALSLLQMFGFGNRGLEPVVEARFRALATAEARLMPRSRAALFVRAAR